MRERKRYQIWYCRKHTNTKIVSQWEGLPGKTENYFLSLEVLKNYLEKYLSEIAYLSHRKTGYKVLQGLLQFYN